MRRLQFIKLIVALASLACCGSIARAEGPLTVTSPSPYRVFQRDAANVGPVRIAGTIAEGAERVEARVTGESADGPLPGDWHKLTLDEAKRGFDHAIPTPAGGWYSVEVRAIKGEQAVQALAIPNVGVGEVFIVAGQSNSTNYGEAKLKPESAMVATFDGKKWREAHDPQPGTHDNSGGGSNWPPFGDAMHKALGVPIAIASTGHGGTSVIQWQPAGTRMPIRPTWFQFVKEADGLYECDGRLFGHLTTRMKQLGPGGFRAVLWHQGESDANQPNPTPRRMSAEEYVQGVTNIITVSRKQTGFDAPWFVAQASYHNPGDTGSPVIRAAQEALWKTGVALQGPDTDALGGANRDGGGRGVHMSRQGQIAAGNAWAEKVAPWVKQQLK